MMDIEMMKKDLAGGAVFPLGEENTAFARYFTGECVWKWNYQARSRKE